MATAFCTLCGAPLTEQSEFCTKCGAPVVSIQMQPASSLDATAMDSPSEPPIPVDDAAPEVAPAAVPEMPAVDGASEFDLSAVPGGARCVCGAALLDGVAFCTTCGAPVAVMPPCAGCGSALAQGAAFCTACGTPVGAVEPAAQEPPDQPGPKQAPGPKQTPGPKEAPGPKVPPGPVAAAASVVSAPVVAAEELETAVPHCTCGAQLREGVAFCTACGKSTLANAPVAETVAAEPVMVPPIVPVAEVMTEPVIETASAPAFEPVVFAPVAEAASVVPEPVVESVAVPEVAEPVVEPVIAEPVSAPAFEPVVFAPANDVTPAPIAENVASPVLAVAAEPVRCACGAELGGAAFCTSCGKLVAGETVPVASPPPPVEPASAAPADPTPVAPTPAFAPVVFAPVVEAPAAPVEPPIVADAPAGGDAGAPCSCGQPLADDAVFCTVCGKPVEGRTAAAAAGPLRFCACGAVLMPDSVFCTACGKTAAAPGAAYVPPVKVPPAKIKKKHPVLRAVASIFLCLLLLVTLVALNGVLLVQQTLSPEGVQATFAEVEVANLPMDFLIGRRFNMDTWVFNALDQERCEALELDKAAVAKALNKSTIKAFLVDKAKQYATLQKPYATVTGEEIMQLIRDNAELFEDQTGYVISEEEYAAWEEYFGEDGEANLARFDLAGLVKKHSNSFWMAQQAVSIWGVVIVAFIALWPVLGLCAVNHMRRAFGYTGITCVLAGLAVLALSVLGMMALSLTGDTLSYMLHESWPHSGITFGQMLGAAIAGMSETTLILGICMVALGIIIFVSGFFFKKPKNKAIGA